MSGQSNRYLSPEQAKRFYDRLGSRQDWQGFFENPAFNEVIARAAFESAHSVLEFGCGTGKLAARLFKHHLPADARLCWAGHKQHNGLALAGATPAVA